MIPRLQARPRRSGLRPGGPLGPGIWPYIFLAPFLILFTIFLIYPIVSTLVLSLERKDGLGPGTFVGLQNYARLLADPRFAIAVRNTILITAAGIFILLPLAFLLALGLNSPRLRARTVFRLLFFLPAATSAVIVAMIGYVFYDQQYGFLNTVFGSDIPWVSSAALILPSIFLLLLWKWTGYNAMYFLAGLQTVSPELVDAAKVDGANSVQIVRYVYLPLMKPIVLVVVVLAILGGAQTFAEPYLLTRGTGGPGQGGLTLAMMMWDAGFRQIRLGYAAAIGYVTVLGAVAASLVAARLLRSDRHE